MAMDTFLIIINIILIIIARNGRKEEGEKGAQSADFSIIFHGGGVGR